MSSLVFRIPSPRGSPLRDLPSSTSVGLKALGLLALPASWTPSFFVLTTALYSLWKRHRESSASLTPQLSSLVDPDTLSSITAGLSDLQVRSTDQILVRSSATTETLYSRGRWESRTCIPTLETLLDTVHSLFEETARFTYPELRDPNFALALVVQRFIPRPLRSGHLSNERRLSRSQKQWICEYHETIAGEPAIQTILVRRSPDASEMPTTLTCHTYKQLIDRLTALAVSATVQNLRVHYEWAWDGDRLWVLQADEEHAQRGGGPHAAHSSGFAPPVAPSLRRFRSFVDVESGRWKKLDCVKTFQLCQLPLPELWVLDHPASLESLQSGDIDQDLKGDLLLLLEAPLVIRTDVDLSGEIPATLLPRTTTLTDMKAATWFLISTSRTFQEAGLSTTQYCFIAHRFIPARSSAFCLAYPGLTRVRIDGIWGLPDGLLYYPHDSFELDASNPSKFFKHIRYKDEYLDVAADGKWLPRRAGAPWDWKDSLSRQELFEIARGSIRVAEARQRSVQVMWFVGIPPDSGYPTLIPWYFAEEVPPQQVERADPRRFLWTRRLLRDWKDIENFDRPERRSLSDELIFLLKPTPAMLRDADFIQAVAKLAREMRAPVELQGSILSHAYYLLQNSGVRVVCTDPFAPKFKRREFGKLVRDLVPVRIQSKKEEAVTLHLTEDQLSPLLRAKAVEEALELFWNRDSPGTGEELADLLEVIRALAENQGLNYEDLELIVKRKREERGGFEKGVILVETREVPLIGIAQPSADLFFNPAASDTTQTPRKGRRIRDMISLRRPRLDEGAITLPLVPPDPVGQTRKVEVELENLGKVMTVTYKEKSIEITVRDGAPPTMIEDRNQLELFSSSTL